MVLLYFHCDTELSIDRYNVHQGTICLVKVDSGELRPGQRIALFHAKDSYVISEVGVLSPSTIKTGK